MLLVAVPNRLKSTTWPSTTPIIESTRTPLSAPSAPTCRAVKSSAHDARGENTRANCSSAVAGGAGAAAAAVRSGASRSARSSAPLMVVVARSAFAARAFAATTAASAAAPASASGARPKMTARVAAKPGRAIDAARSKSSEQ